MTSSKEILQQDLEDLFGDRLKEFSPELRHLLTSLWLRGARHAHHMALQTCHDLAKSFKEPQQDPNDFISYPNPSPKSVLDLVAASINTLELEFLELLTARELGTLEMLPEGTPEAPKDSSRSPDGSQLEPASGTSVSSSSTVTLQPHRQHFR